MKHIRNLIRSVVETCRGVIDNTRGASLLVFAMTAPPLIGFVGVGVETGLWYHVKRQAQTAADTSAVAGVLERSTGSNAANLIIAVKRETQRNGFADGTTNTISVHNPPTAGPSAGEPDAVEVIVTHRPKLLFASLFISDSQIVARAVANAYPTGRACVLALNKTKSGSLKIIGTTDLDVKNCTIAANSNDNAAINVGGSATLQADSIWTPGGFQNFGTGNITLQHPARTNVWPLSDPYASLTIPTLGACNYNNSSFGNGTHTISPGVYCNGMNFGAQTNVVMNPGVYYIDKGDFSVGAQATITCNCVNSTDGVTIVLTSTGAISLIGDVNINGGASVNLRASSGESDYFRGLLMYQDRRAPSNGTNKLNGGSGMILTGALYFPAQYVEWSGGNASNATSCTVLIADTVGFTGDSVMDDSTCLEYGVQPIEIKDVRVVE